MQTRSLWPARLFLTLVSGMVLFVGFAVGVQVHAASMESGAMQMQGGVCPTGCIVLPKIVAPEQEADLQQPRPNEKLPAYLQFQHFYVPKELRLAPNHGVAVMRPPDNTVLSVFRF